jgi:hypothetical protein
MNKNQPPINTETHRLELGIKEPKSRHPAGEGEEKSQKEKVATD